VAKSLVQSIQHCKLPTWGITVAINSNTQFDGFDACAAANATCVQSGQSVEVDLMLLASGTFLAKKIELRDDAQQAADDDSRALSLRLTAPPSLKWSSTTNFEPSRTFPSRPCHSDAHHIGRGTSFQVDANGLAVPSTLQQGFEGATDTSQLLPGQTVQVRKLTMTGGPAPAAPITITTDRVRLRDTRFHGNSGPERRPEAISNVGGLPGLFPQRV